MLTKLLTTAICCAAIHLSAQDVTVINRFHGDPVDDVPENYVLSGVREQTIIINDYEPALSGKQSLLNQMISFGLKSYIDANYRINDGQIRVYPSTLDFDENAGAIVKNAIWINDLPFSELFPGFSDEVKNLASHLAELNGTSIAIGSEKYSNSSNELSLYGFQKLVFELKEAALAESYEFIEKYYPGENEEVADSDKEVTYMASKEFELVASPSFEDGLGDLSLNPELFSSDKKPSKRNRREKNDFSQEVVALLEENNRILADYSQMFQNLQSQIDEINRRDDSDLRKDMAEMRQMISELKEEPPGRVGTDEPEYLIFEKNEYSLSQVQKARLNKTVVRLVKNPGTKALVTGYADQSGDSEYNAWISKQRAESVKEFLASMGIGKNRIVVTFFGDTESTTSGPADRRVEVSLID